MPPDSLIYKTDRPWPNTRLKTAAIVGHTTTTSSRIWLRTGSLGHFVLVVYPVEGSSTERARLRTRLMARLKRVPLPLKSLPPGGQSYPFDVPGYATDTTHVVEVAGLSVGTEYLYALWGQDRGGSELVDRILLGQDRPYTFRTLRAGDGPLTFAFFSCHMPFATTLFGKTRIVNMNTWETMRVALERHAQDDLQFIIAAGDQAYADGVETLSIWNLLVKRMRKSRGELLPSRDDMVSWYRDIYRGYWGFDPLQRVFSSHPTYMIWDDHEIGDGWGSFKSRELDDLIAKRGWSAPEKRELLARMFDAARQVYGEYEHNHNPPTAPGEYDYSYLVGRAAFYILDGRGQRNINQSRYKILGAAQFRRFEAWLDGLNPAQTRYVFVVSAVPLLHLSALAGAAADLVKSLRDDLRDSWDHEEHDRERREFVDLLFGAAEKGIRVAVLSGDVHTAAAFRIENKDSRRVIYQLTSSAITYNVPRISGWLLGRGTSGRDKTRDGHPFERVALYGGSNFGMVRVEPAIDRVEFRLYGQEATTGDGASAESVPYPVHSHVRKKKRELVLEPTPVTHSIATIPLMFA